MRIEFGTLDSVYGVPRSSGDIKFMIADVVLAGNGLDLAFPLREFVGSATPPVLAVPLRDGFEAAWARARLPQVFRFTPEPAQSEKCFLWSGVVAVFSDSLDIPFILRRSLRPFRSDVQS